MGDFNYYLSFTIMFGLPVGIVVVGLGMYCYKVRMITHKLHTMSVEEKAETKKDAFHQLFRIVSISIRIILDFFNLTSFFIQLFFVRPMPIILGRSIRVSLPPFYVLWVGSLNYKQQ